MRRAVGAEGLGALPPVRLAHLWLVLPFAFVFAYASAIPVLHTDFYYHLLNGRLMVEGAGLLETVLVTYAPLQEPALNQAWLTQALYYLLYRLGGHELIALWHSLVVTGAFLALRQQALRLSGSPQLAALAVLVALVLAATNLAPRPQSMALALFTTLLWLLEGSTLSGRRLWLVATLSALWANVHGSFVLAPLVVAAYLAGALVESRARPTLPVRRLGLALVASLVGTLASPLGPTVYGYAAAITANPVIRSAIVEWRPPSPEGLVGLPFFASLPVALAGLVVGRRGLRPAHILLLLGLLALALAAQRNVVWWGLAMPPILAGWLAGAARRAEGRPEVKGRAAPAERPALNTALLSVTVLIALLGLPWLKPYNPLLAPALRTVVDPDRPQGVADFFERERAPGRVLSRMEWGGYLAWRLWPQNTLFLDARIERYRPEVWQDYFAIMAAAPDWSELVDRYGADFLVVDPRYSPRLLAELGRHADWQVRYQDEQGVVFERATKRA